MDNDTKVILSLGELTIATDKNIILTKRAIIEKAVALFGKQVVFISNVFAVVLSRDAILATSIPKIAKGENYKGLPYVMMDYPATFTTNDIFAIRTMFWWGNFISITLHLKGVYKERYFEKILATFTSDSSFYISISDKEWEHDVTTDNFQKGVEVSPAVYNKLAKQNFIKIALKYELHQWNMMQSVLPDGYKKLAEIIIG